MTGATPGATGSRHKKSTSRLPERVALHLLLVCGAIVSVFPFYWMVTTSLNGSSIFTLRVELWPSIISLQHYAYAFSRIPLLRNLANSMLVAACFSILSLLLTSSAGFAFAKLRFPGKEVLFGCLLVLMIVPFELQVVPLYRICSLFRWVNTYFALIVPQAASIMGIFFMRQIIRGVPDELLDAAKIEGSSYGRIYLAIVLPLSTAGIIALLIINFMASWNDFFWPLIALRTKEMFTIVVAIPSLRGETFNVPWGSVMAASAVAVLPLMLVFFVLQRYFRPEAMSGAFR
jgi:ABC-type glycerol-3-phosphate transport system permease component